MTFRIPLIIGLIVSSGFMLCLAAADQNQAPTTAQVLRAYKITGALGLSDSVKALHVRDLIASQYRDLNVIHSKRDDAVKAANASVKNGMLAAETATKLARAEAEAAQSQLHAEYLAQLAVELTPSQIDQVKDGMTYGVLPLTYRVYQEMLPNLTAEQKTQILAWLTEAREHAMDGSTSDEKHAWFGKYKGRINNYLSKAGIDMKQAEKEMTQRQKSTVTK